MIPSFINFNDEAFSIFHFQYENCEIYRRFCQSLSRTPDSVRKLTDIPFLPISFFKTHRVVSTKGETPLYFESSGTSRQTKSKHFVAYPFLYEESISKGFKHFFGEISEYTLYGLLPHYLDQPNSSLVYMMRHLAKNSNPKPQHFYLNQYDTFSATVKESILKNEKIFILGITFALLDWSENFKTDYQHLTIIETGGMKGTRPEMPKEALWKLLQESFPNATIGSEYGMCELLSQSYAQNTLDFHTPSWKKMLISDIQDPLLVSDEGFGQGCVIDLANKFSCSFIQTEDLVRLNKNGTFKIIGRKDNADIRGCSLMV